MYIRMLATSALVLALPALVNAQTWTSPDGFLSITAPDAYTFQEIPTPPPPFIGLWVSNDESMKFGVIKTQIPATAKLIQSSVEQGLAEEISGEVLRLPTRDVSGHEVWTMTGKGPSVEVTQALVRHDGSVYKLMAATVESDADGELVDRFIGSLAIAEHSTGQPSKQAATQPVQDLGGGVDLHNLSKAIGGAAALLGIGLLAYFAMRGKKSRQS